MLLLLVLVLLVCLLAYWIDGFFLAVSKLLIDPIFPFCLQIDNKYLSMPYNRYIPSITNQLFEFYKLTN